MINKMAFIKEVHTDAYTATLAHIWADCWALGYEAARRDFILAGTDGRGYVERGDLAYPILIKLDEDGGFANLRRRAQREMLKDSERRNIEAMAALAPLFEPKAMNPHPDYTEVRVANDQRCLIIHEREDEELTAVSTCLTALRELDAESANGSRTT